MKVALKYIVNSVQSLRDLSALKFKATISFQLAKLIKSVEDELTIYEETRTETVKKYSTDGQQVDEASIPQFVAELNELMEKEVEVYEFKLSHDDLADKDISAQQLIQLDWLITNPS